jgi:hypothetical protein
MPQVNFVVPERLLARIRQAAGEQGKTLAEWFRDAAREKLEREPNQVRGE